MYVDDITLASKTENIEPTWKIHMKDVDLGEPTSFLDHVHWSCTQRECQISKDFVANCRDMIESRFSAGAKENYPPERRGNLMQKRSLLGPMTWKVTQRNVWKDIENLQIKRLDNNQLHAWMAINLKKKKMSQWENCLQFAHKLF